VAGSLQNGFHNTPGIASVYGISLNTIICQRGASPISLAGSTLPEITDNACRDRSRLITDCTLDYIEKFVAGVPMHRQSRPGLKPRKLCAPPGRRIGPEHLGLNGRGHRLPLAFADFDYLR